MSKPTLDDLLKSAARWTGEHNGIRYELSWHGQSEYNPEGTWCYYIHLSSEQFSVDDWSQLRLTREDKTLLGESWHRCYDYHKFPDLDAHGGWTFGEMDTYLGRDGIEHEHIKVGCDYSHLWDRESGFWQGREDIERDAKHSIDLLCEMFPRRRPRCAYSGKYDDPEHFYKARNGATVHKSQLNKFSPDHWPMWLPEDEVAEPSQ